MNLALSFPPVPTHFYFRQDLRYGAIKPSLTTLLMKSGYQHHVAHVFSCLFDSQLTSLDSHYACQRMFSYNMYNQSKFIISQMKHQLDATLCRFYFCRVTLHVSGASIPHQEYLKLVQRPLVHVFRKNI